MNNQKKIAFIGPLPPPLGGVASINKSFQSLAFESSINISFDTSKKKLREDLYAKFPWRNVTKEIAIGKEIERFIRTEKPVMINLFITSGYAILRDIYFLKKIKKFKIPVVIHFHSKTNSEFALKPSRLKIVGKFFNRYADKIILLSQVHYDFFTAFFPKEKCTIIENFVDYSLFKNEKRFKPKDFLFIGRLTKEKGFFDLLAAAKQLKESKTEFNINVIGVAANQEDEDLIQKIITEHKLEKNVHILGPKFDTEKTDIFKKSSILLFPSHFENSPVVLKEAIAAGMAIISSDIDANLNVLGERRNYITHKKGDPYELFQKMSTLISDELLLNSMMNESLLIKDYDKNVAIRKMNKIITELC